MSNLIVKELPISDDNMLGWTIEPLFLKEVKDLATSDYSCYSISEEDIEGIIMALVQLGYMRSVG